MYILFALGSINEKTVVLIKRFSLWVNIRYYFLRIFMCFYKKMSVLFYVNFLMSQYQIF